MANGRHVASTKRRRSYRWLIVIGIVVLILGLIAGGTAYAAYRYDQGNLHRLMPGVRVMGIDVGGMTREEATEAVRARVETELSKKLTVEAANKEWETSSADLNTKADVGIAVKKAFEVNEQYTWTSRVYHRLMDSPVVADVDVGFRLDKSVIDSFVGKIGGAIGEAPVNGGLRLEGSRLVYVNSRPGRELVQAAALAKIRAGLRDDSRVVKVPVKKVAPETAGDDQQTIVIRLGENKLYLYRGKKIVESYPVATGAPGFPTPDGSFQIVEKRKNPTWVNPDPNGWGSSMPAEIPPGPGNPLGTRALNLNAPGIRIHGTYDLASLGTAASHGCIRMSIKDVEQLYDIVDVGTPVLIIK
ncbi:MAG: L,D-transpeptidase family protein [Actinomycetota bacterium]